MKHQCDTTILGGLPVTIEYTVARAEPDVGIMSDYVDEWYITHIKDKPINPHLRRALEQRVHMRKEEAHLLETLMENI